jgi:hypothetical protein
MAAKLYIYKLISDEGGAPCVQGELLSLGICKPKIRSTANKGDIIFGFLGSTVDSEERLTYIAVVTNKETAGDYYTEPEYRRRRDSIYRKLGSKLVIKQRRNYGHDFPEQIIKDIGQVDRFGNYPKANVLLSTDFRYFGDSNIIQYRANTTIVECLNSLNQGHRVNHKDELRIALLKLKLSVWKNHPGKLVWGKPFHKSGQSCEDDDNYCIC